MKAALILLATGVVCADPVETPHTTADVFLSSPDFRFVASGSALYLQPSGSNLNYAAEAVPLPTPSPHWKIHNIDTDYHWGFDIELATFFHATHSHLILNWEHFHSSDSSSKTVSSENMIGPFFEIGPDALPYKKARGHVDFHFDEVELDYGIMLSLGDRLDAILYGGVRFARIDQTLRSRFSSLDGTIVRTIKSPSTFRGAGPHLGVWVDYDIAKGFGIAGGAATALLVGPQTNHTFFKAISPAQPAAGAPTPNIQSTHVPKKTQVIPGFEAQIGVSYSFSWDKSVLSLEAGYNVQLYLNAIQAIDIGSEVVTPPVTPDTIGVYARTFQTSLSNFALAGPYFMIELGF
jgi:hypothetical protein